MATRKANPFVHNIEFIVVAIGILVFLAVIFFSMTKIPSVSPKEIDQWQTRYEALVDKWTKNPAPVPEPVDLAKDLRETIEVPPPLPEMKGWDFFRRRLFTCPSRGKTPTSSARPCSPPSRSSTP